MNAILNFIKNNLLIILAILVAGNIYFFMNTSDDTSRFVGKLKIRTSSLVYDRLNDLMTQLSEKSGENSPVIKYKSYRNEQYYIFEIFVESQDSALILKKVPEITNTIQSDTIIKMYYFEKLATLSNIIDAQVQFNTSTDSLLKNGASNNEVKNDLEYKKLFMQLNSFNLNLSRTNLMREFEIYPFSGENITYEKSSRMKEWIKINVVLSILAIFGTIIFRQLKN